MMLERDLEHTMIVVMKNKEHVVARIRHTYLRVQHSYD